MLHGARCRLENHYAATPLKHPCLRVAALCPIVHFCRACGAHFAVRPPRFAARPANDGDDIAITSIDASEPTDNTVVECAPSVVNNNVKGRALSTGID